MKEEYNKDYFERGEELGISGYTNYKWLPSRTLETACEIIRRADIKEKDLILDVGCAKGYLIKAFKWLGYNAYGLDISIYAKKVADKEIKERIFGEEFYPIKKNLFDIIICKDTVEHITKSKIDKFLKGIYNGTKKKAIFIIPLGDGKKYNIPRYDIDITHKIMEDSNWWLKKLKKAGFFVSVLTDDMTRIKPNWNIPNGNVYIEAIVTDERRRIS